MDAAEENSLLPGITDPPKIKIDDETLESLMASGKNEDPDADVKIAKPRRSESPSLTFADTQAVNLSDIRREKDAKDKERVLSVDADTEHTVIFKRPQG